MPSTLRAMSSCARLPQGPHAAHTSSSPTHRMEAASLAQLTRPRAAVGNHPVRRTPTLATLPTVPPACPPRPGGPRPHHPVPSQPVLSPLRLQGSPAPPAPSPLCTLSRKVSGLRDDSRRVPAGQVTVGPSCLGDATVVCGAACQAGRSGV